MQSHRIISAIRRIGFLFWLLLVIAVGAGSLFISMIRSEDSPINGSRAVIETDASHGAPPRVGPSTGLPDTDDEIQDPTDDLSQIETLMAALRNTNPNLTGLAKVQKKKEIATAFAMNLNPHEAAEALELLRAEFNDSDFSQIADTYVARMTEDVPFMKSWLIALQDSVSNGIPMTKASDYFALFHTEDALSMAAASSPGLKRTLLFAASLRIIGETDFRRAFELANQYGQPVSNSISANIAAHAIGSGNMPALMEQMIAFKGFENRREAISTALRQWATSDPTTAAAYVGSLPTENIELEAPMIEALIYSWTTTDSVAASEWLAHYSPGVSRDAGAVALASVIGNSNPEQAVPWIQSIEDEVLRNNSLRRLAQAWRARDPANADIQLSVLLSEKEWQVVTNQPTQRK